MTAKAVCFLIGRNCQKRKGSLKTCNLADPKSLEKVSSMRRCLESKT